MANPQPPHVSRRTLTIIKSIGLTILLFFITFFVIELIYRYTFGRNQSIVFGAIGIWIVLAYITIPRLHRRLTKLYLPNYYIGRTRTGDGLLGDPVNLAFIGKKKDVIRAMEQAGWTKADKLSFRTALKMIVRSLTRKSYPNAPVSSLFLFSNRQSFAFQQEVGGSTSKRHHIRFWRTPRGWYLPGGFRADWLAAATYDRSVGFSMYTFQITHKIEANIDTERDYVIQTLRDADPTIDVDIHKHFASAYHDRNGGGDLIQTDGAMPFVSIYESQSDA